MSIIDDALNAKLNYAKRHIPKLGQRPYPKIAVVTCMDPRLSNLPEILGLPHADIDVIRTGGNRRCTRRAHCFYPSAWNDRDHAPQPHRVRIYYIH
jgi:carbonic anhydrase